MNDNISITMTDDGMVLVYRHQIADNLRGLLLTNESPDFHRGAEAMATTCGVRVRRYVRQPEPIKSFDDFYE
jgi:hypothetical protein